MADAPREPRLPAHVAIAIAAQTLTDPRTVARVYRDPASASRNAARARAAEALRARGLLPQAA